MKKIIFILVLLLFKVIFSYSIYAWWYNNGDVEYWKWYTWTEAPLTDTGNSCGSDCYKDVVPHETICPSDNTNGDTRSAVWWTEPWPGFSDDASDNRNLEWGYKENVDETWNLNCFYWDDIYFKKSTYVLFDWEFDDFWVANWLEKNLEIRFYLEKETDWLREPIRLDDTTYWLDNISFKIIFDDKTYLDQYNKTWKAVDVVWATTNDLVWNTRTVTYDINSANLSDYSDWNWKFLFKYKFFNSTKWVTWVNTDDFVIKNIEYTVKFRWWVTYTWKNIYSASTSWTVVNNLSINVKPLYEIEFDSDIEEQWFLPTVTQTWIIKVIKNEPDFTSETEKKLYLEFWSWVIHNDVDELDLDLVETDTNIWEWYTNKTNIWSLVNWLSYNINSFISQFDVVWILDRLYLSSHISFKLPDWNWWTKTVVYNSSIVWMNHYWAPTEFLSSIQTWLKVLWSIHDNNEQNITEEQNQLNIHWNIIKASIEKQIRSNAFSIVKNLNSPDYSGPWTEPVISNITSDFWKWDNSNDWVIAGNILYFWNMWWNKVVLNDITENKFDWKRTIVVVWWNLYIKSDIINNSLDDILWIIVLEDENNKWWNLYIDPEVVNLEAVIYTDKSLISYNDALWEIDWSISRTVLENQLFIHWSVYSNNTIGWTIKDPSECPFYAYDYYPSFTCSYKVAQKFDLNFLRRYYPTLPWESSNLTTEDNPIVIKYNPIIQISPPPLFKK